MWEFFSKTRIQKYGKWLSKKLKQNKPKQKTCLVFGISVPEQYIKGIT